MQDTSLTLLDQLCRAGDEDAWRTLVELYQPLLHVWLTRFGVPLSERDDLVQEVLLVVVRELPGFRHNRRTGAFRAWLKQVLVHRLRGYWREKNRRAGPSNSPVLQLDELADDASELSRVWNREHQQQLAQRLLKLVSNRFEANTMEAFRRLSLEGQDAATVAAALNMTLGAVFTAKSRVLRELRQLGRGILEENED